MNNDEQAIRNLIDTWLRATREGDVETVLSLVAPDVVFLSPGEPPMQGRDAFGVALRAVMGAHAIEPAGQVEEIEVFGDVAYSRTRLEVTVTSKHGGTPVRRSGHTLSILRRFEDGKWRLTRDANMLGPAARALASAIGVATVRLAVCYRRKPAMLDLRPNCECCDRDIAADSRDAFICTFECTFCRDCVEGKLAGECPNCGGELVRRPVRRAAMLLKYPGRRERTPIKQRPAGSPCARSD